MYHGDMKLVRIDWIDRKTAPNEWEYIEGLESLPPVGCTSVGFLVEDTPTHKTIAHSLSETQICGRITIPTACIKKCRRLG
jgi:hypothetical protein